MLEQARAKYVLGPRLGYRPRFKLDFVSALTQSGHVRLSYVTLQQRDDAFWSDHRYHFICEQLFYSWGARV
jgi:hypothetical protein